VDILVGGDKRDKAFSDLSDAVKKGGSYKSVPIDQPTEM